MRDETIELLRELVAIDSVNPTLVPGGAGEQQIAEFIAQHLRALSIDAVIQQVAPQRANVIGVIESKQRGPSLMLCGHSDTVGVEGMDAPFTPVERDGRMYGRGTQDMKGGVAAILGAARVLANNLAAGRVVIAIVADEEHSSIGAEALVKEWKCDAAIVCEPTDLSVAIGHKGFEWVEIITEGVAAHGSRPDDGVDAIALMGRVLNRLEALDRNMPKHPLLGRASLHASLISGGRELSTYPDRCTLHVERRTIAGEPQEITLREIDTILAALRNEDPKFRATSRFLFTRSPYLTPKDSPLPQLIGRPTMAASFWTDAAVLGAAGMDCVVFGPGGAGLHGIDEYVKIDEVLTCRDVLVDVARKY
ncbi:MAG TPA: M20/M25/M40 family metallo-hydrolase, partial [Thermoanaerobaculia bacterium]|nr:M20/M25/M40 family metallo-hydrolase [Thermoanaerobaculia bacterium]